MKDQVLQAVKCFVEKKWVPGKPILLGYSGGPDSKGLLYALLESRRFFAIEIHLAHIDHGWRSSSRAEAALLQHEAEHLQLPFHLKVMDSSDFTQGNSEAQGRQARLKFFSELYQKYDCQALLLAHQADDQAETVLKRLFEGAHLLAMGGTLSETILGGMNVWRPLLSIRKNKIITWLQERNLRYIEDETNGSALFLRGKMRSQLLPVLKDAFGKEIIENLCFLGEQAQEVRSFLLKKNGELLENTVRRPWGISWTISEPLEPLELRFLLKEWLQREGICVSRQVLQSIELSILEKGAPKKFPLKEGVLYINESEISFLFNI